MGVEALLLGAARDGVAPAVLLKVQKPGNGFSTIAGRHTQAQYLFNCPEAFSRLALEHKVRPSAALAAVFFTGLNPPEAGGLIGLLLRLSQDGHGEVHLIGPQGLTAQVIVTECTNPNQLVFEDAHIRVWAVRNAQQWAGCPICAHQADNPVHSLSTSTSTSTSSSSECSEPSSSAGSEVDQQDQNTLVENGKQAVEQSSDFCNLGRTAKSDDSGGPASNADDHLLQVKNRNQNGIPPNFKKAASPEWVVTATSAKEGILAYVVEVSHFHSSVALVHSRHKEDWSRLSSLPDSRSHTHTTSAIFHFGPADGASARDMQDKVSGNKTGIKQVYLGNAESFPSFGFNTSLKLLAKLNIASKNVFPCPLRLQANAPASVAGAEVPQLLSTLQLLGEPRPDQSLPCEPVEWAQVQQELLMERPVLQQQLAKGLHATGLACGRPACPTPLSGNQQAAAQLRSVLRKRNHSSIASHVDTCVDTDDNPEEIVFLGTGCAEPSQYRGSSSILLKSRTRYMMLDAGEGAVGQLVRMYGSCQAQAMLQKVVAVWISHKHADHCTGLPGVIAARAVEPNPIVVIAPHIVHEWLKQAYPWLESAYFFIDCRKFTSPTSLLSTSSGWYGSEQEEAALSLLRNSGFISIHSVPVEHCPFAYGLVLNSKQGWSLVYSGDTRPCHRLLQAGMNCTVLIHEATFEPDLLDHAIKKRHSTTDEALRVAENMRTQHVILTHFSQRYPYLVSSGQAANRPFLTAFDGMVLPIASLPALYGLLPVLAAVLADKGDADAED
eukprot:jgi/Chlat1/6964/Chrsp52S06644